MTLLIPIQLACNNTNGHCSGVLPQLQIGYDSPLTLEAMWWDDAARDFSGPEFEYRFSSLPDWNRPGWRPLPCRGRFRIATRWFPFHAYRPHVGNIIWDMVLMPAKECLRMCRWLRRKGWFTVTEGPDELFDTWLSRSEIKPQLLSLTSVPVRRWSALINHQLLNHKFPAP